MAGNTVFNGIVPEIANSTEAAADAKTTLIHAAKKAAKNTCLKYFFIIRYNYGGT